MAKEINSAPLLKRMTKLKKNVEDLSTELNETEDKISEKKWELGHLIIRLEKIKTNVLDDTVNSLCSLCRRKYKDIGNNFLNEFVEIFTMKKQENLSKMKEIYIPLQEKQEILKEKLKTVEEIRDVILSKVLEAHQSTDLSEWSEFEQTTTNFMNEIKIMNLQADTEFLDFDDKMICFEESVEQILDNIHRLKKMFKGPQPKKIQTIRKRIQNIPFLAHLKREDLQINQENHKSKESFQNMNEEFEFQPQELENKLAKEVDETRSFQSENEKYLTELLGIKDQEIKELERELEKMKEIIDFQKQNEARFAVKIEEIQESYLKKLKEKDALLEEIKEVLGKLRPIANETLEQVNKMTESNLKRNNQDKNLHMEEESDLPDQKESQIPKSQLNKSRSVNGKRSLDSLLVSPKKSFGKNLDSKARSSRKICKNEKENLQVSSEKSEKDSREFDVLKKKIKQ